MSLIHGHAFPAVYFAIYLQIAFHLSSAFWRERKGLSQARLHLGFEPRMPTYEAASYPI